MTKQDWSFAAVLTVCGVGGIIWGIFTPFKSVTFLSGVMLGEAIMGFVLLFRKMRRSNED